MRGGGGGFSGGHVGGSVGGMHVGGSVGGMHVGGGSWGGAYRGGGAYYGHGYYGRGYYGYGRGYYGGWGWPYWGYPYWGFGIGYGYGYGYWPGYYDYGYDSYPSYSYSYPAYSYPAYQPASNVTVVYPQTAQAYANPVLRQYDEYGQELQVPQQQQQPSSGSSGSPLYLIAFRDQSIRAAVAYWVDGRTLHYVTPQREERQASLDSIDRETSIRLNRERRVPFSLPVPTQQQ